MKYILLLSCLLPSLLTAQTAQEILQQVHLHLPQQSLTFSGTLNRKNANGFNRVSLPIQSTLRLGETPARAHYHIGETTLDLHWENNQPTYTFSDATLKPTHEIDDSGMSWNDLSLGFLWWPNATLIGPARKINREAWLLEIPVPTTPIISASGSNKRWPCSSKSNGSMPKADASKPSASNAFVKLTTRGSPNRSSSIITATATAPPSISTKSPTYKKSGQNARSLHDSSEPSESP
jgi:hypothetical protein